MKKVVTWIIVADHQHARLFQNAGPNRGIEPLDDVSFDDHLPRSGDIISDRPGRGVSSRDGRRHGLDAHTDAHRAAGAAFIHRVAELVTKAGGEGRYERLVLAAPPRALGELRDALPTQIRKKVIGELTEDLTKAPAEQILRHLAGVIAA